jgi:RNA polymerase sigma-70 factor, ECF subfamily
MLGRNGGCEKPIGRHGGSLDDMVASDTDRLTCPLAPAGGTPAAGASGKKVLGATDDETFLPAARNGDGEAFLAILDAHDRMLRSLAFRMLGDRDQMDDVLQEVALKAFKSLPKFRGDASLATWLYRITYTSCLNRLRSAGRTVSLLDPEEDPAGTVASHLYSGDAAESVIRRIELSAALASLTPEQRAVVALVLEEGLDHHTAAHVLGIPMGTVASRLAAARAALRRFLKEPPPIGEAR